MRWLAIIVVCGCGRVSFDPVGDGRPGDGAGSSCARAQRVTTGRNHSCLVDADGAVWCWGRNLGRQCAPDDPGENLLVPHRVALSQAARDVEAGKDFTCALLVDDSVACWGSNASGQLGTGAIGDGLTTSTPAVAAVELGVLAQTACVRRTGDNAIVCWGESTYDERGGLGASGVPTVIPGTAGAKHLGLGHRHACFVDSADQVECWGRNTSNQLGTTDGTRPTPEVVPGLPAATQVTAAGRTSCAVLADHSIRCWGRGENGHLGTGNDMSSASPVAALVTGAREVDLGSNGGCAVGVDGSATCWGDILAGDGTFATGLLPRASLATGVTQLSSHYTHDCAVADGRALCWGVDDDGQLGRGTRDVVSTPVSVALGAQVASFGTWDHVCVLLTDSTIRCWGMNQSGQLGDGTRDGRVVPVAVSSGLATPTGIAVGQSSTCAWDAGVARCWGYNYYGELGGGFSSLTEVNPVSVMNLASTGSIMDISMGAHHACALAGSTVRCWGSNSNGQVGDGTTTDRFAPVSTSVTTARAIAAGITASCAVTQGNALFCWGENDHGQVGDGTTTDRWSPTPIVVGASEAVQTVALGGEHACAVTVSGALYCWGDNGTGELGLGDKTDRHSPTLVIASGVAGVVAGGYTVCARMSNGTRQCWGNNHSGQLGNGGTTDVTTPEHNAYLDSADEVVLGHEVGCARTGPAFSCWGIKRFVADGDTSIATPMEPAIPCL